LSAVDNSCRSCGKPLVNRRGNARFCNDAHKQRFHRRKIDPGVGSPERKRIQQDAYRELTLGSVRDELREAGLMPEVCNEDYFAAQPPKRNQGYYESKAPSEDDLFNPVYAAMDDAHDLYQGLVVTETVKVEDTYREWLRSGKQEQPLLGQIVTREKELKVTIGEMSKTDLERQYRESPKGEWVSFDEQPEEPVTKEVLDQLDRIEEQTNRILVRLGDDVAIGEAVDRFIVTATSGDCGVQVFAGS
jgi:hypothetical protein